MTDSSEYFQKLLKSPFFDQLGMKLGAYELIPRANLAINGVIICRTADYMQIQICAPSDKEFSLYFWPNGCITNSADRMSWGLDLDADEEIQRDLAYTIGERMDAYVKQEMLRPIPAFASVKGLDFVSIYEMINRPREAGDSILEL